MKCFKENHKHEQKKCEGRYPPPPLHATFNRIKFEVHGLNNFSESEKRKFNMALGIGTLVLNSQEFKDLIVNSKVVEDRGFMGKHVWELLCTGKDLYNSEDDYDIDVFVTMYNNFWTGTIGYTYLDTFKTWINRKFYQNFDEAEILGNVIHEALHNFGFSHTDMSKRYDSVPYKVGYFARDLAKKILEGQVLTPLKVG